MMGNPIGTEVEVPVRRLLGNALRSEKDEFEGRLRQLESDDLLGEAIVLVQRIAAVVAIDLCNGEVPNAEALREIAGTATEIEDDYNLDFGEVHDFLARVVFGGERIDSVMEPMDAARLPFIITSILVSASRDADNGEEWWNYLDAIETTIEQAPEPT